MLNIFKFISVLVLILAAAGANAQCAGMAGGVCLGTNGQPYNGQDNYQPQHHWIYNYGAIAIDNDNDNNQYYSTRDEVSAKVAANKVLNYCNTYNHTDKCEIVGRAYFNVCVSYAWGRTHKGFQVSNLQTADTQQKADYLSMKMCKEDPASTYDCVVDYHDCLYPKQID